MDAPFPVIRMTGSPLERGMQYGAAARERIERSLTFYSRYLAHPPGLTFEEICSRVRSWEDAWQAQEPELFTELEGIARGAGFGFTEILALNARASFVREPGYPITTDLPIDRGDCTAFWVSARASRDGHVRVGQTWDYLSGIADTVVLLHVQPDHGPRQLILAEAGQVGRQGINTAGIALYANGLNSKAGVPGSLPTPFRRRKILQASVLEGAVDAAVGHTREIATNVLLAHASGWVVNLECEADRVEAIFPADDWFVHTNHFLAPHRDVSQAHDPSASSLVRLRLARTRIADAVGRGGVSEEDLRDLVASHIDQGTGICTHPQPTEDPADEWQTVAAAIADLTTGEVAFAAGPPCQARFAVVSAMSGNVVQH